MASKNTFEIREAGKNGSIVVHDDRLVRTVKKRLGKDDVQTIPMRGITSVSHDRKTVTTDVVTVVAGVTTFEWKVKDADRMVRMINEAVAALR